MTEKDDDFFKDYLKFLLENGVQPKIVVDLIREWNKGRLFK